MSENIPSIPGGLPPKPAEVAKIQPKKETVRINLPPKPTASPTIKLPTLPAGAPPVSLGTAAPIAASAAAPAPASKVPPPPASGAPVTRVAGGSPNRPSAPPSGVSATPAHRPVQAPTVATVSKLDKGLAVFAAVVSLIAVGGAVYLAFFTYHESVL